MDSLTADQLLIGPRGRRLCYSLIEQTHLESWYRLGIARAKPDAVALKSELASAVSATDLEAVAGWQDPAQFHNALGQTVRSAMYWQPPHDEDRLLELPDLREVLAPVAEAIVNAPATRWWSTPLADDDQHFVQWLDQVPMDPPGLVDTEEILRLWLTDHEAAEVDPSLPDDPTANFGGSWWSTPPTTLISTTRSLSGIGVVGLTLVEDGLGWTEAASWHLQPVANARVYEIAGPQDWIQLASGYPLDATRTRRQVWFQTTGLRGPWVMPNWAAVADDYDAVHLSVAGYLTTAGRALAMADRSTLLGGWGPDQTFWLSHSPRRAGASRHWRLAQDGRGGDIAGLAE